MESLVALASQTDLRPVPLPSGREAKIRALCVQFARATPDRLKPGLLAPTYTSKPLVSVDGDAMFGELAIVRWLEKHGWEGVWVDTFHGQKFWRVMPHKSSPVVLPPPVQARYDAVKAANGGRASGFFDVMAWRGEQIIHLEYKGSGDLSNRNEAAWIEAALAAGVPEFDLWFVLHPKSRSMRRATVAAV